MRIREFIDKYCMDIVSESKQRDSLLDSDDFTYDAIVQDPDGTDVKIVYAGDEEIPISEILSLDRQDFIKIYPSFQAQEVYDNYIDSIIVLEGEEALAHIRNEMLRERTRIESYSKFVDSI